MLVKRTSSEFHLCKWNQILLSSFRQQNLPSYEKWTYSITLLEGGHKTLLKGLVWLQCRHLQGRRRAGLWPGNTWSSILHVPSAVAGGPHNLHNLLTPARGGQGEIVWSEKCRIILTSSKVTDDCYWNKKNHLVLSKDDNIWKITNCTRPLYPCFS